MSEERAGVPAVDDAMDRDVEAAWKRFAPLSVGSVASSAVIVAALALVRRLLGPRSRLLGWASAGVLLPLALWLLWQAEEPEDGEAEHGAARQEDARLEESEH